MPVSINKDDNQYLQFKEGLANAMPSIVKTQGLSLSNEKGIFAAG